MSDGAALQVIILRDGLLVGTEAFVPGTFVLGSGAEADLKLDDSSIAPQHAVLFFQNGRAAIQQTEGVVHVNGHPVRACEVRPVDEINLGPFVLKLRLLKRGEGGKPAPSPELARMLSQPTAPPPPAPAPSAPAAPRKLVPAGPAMNRAGETAVVRPKAPAPIAPPVAPVEVPNPAARPRTNTDDLALLFGNDEAPAPEPVPVGTVAVRKARPAEPAAVPNGTVAFGQVARAPAPAAPPPSGTVAFGARPAPAPAPAPTGTVAFGRGQAPAAPPARGTVAFGRGAQPAAPVEPPVEEEIPTVPRFELNKQLLQQAAPIPAIEQVTQPSARREQISPEPMPVEPTVLSQTKRKESLPEILLDLAAITGPRPLPRDDRFRVPSSGRKGKPRLTVELFWGDARQASHTLKHGRRLMAGDPPPLKPWQKLNPLKDRGVDPFTLHGFTLKPGPFVLAESQGETFRLNVPPQTKVEKLRQDGHFTPLQPNEPAGIQTLSLGQSVRLVSGPMSLRAYVAPPAERFWGNPLKGLPWLAIFLMVLFGGGVVFFALRAPRDPELPDFAAKDLAPVAVRLLRPDKPKKKPEKPKPEKAKELAEKKPEEKPKPIAQRPKPTPKPEPKPQPEAPPAPEVKALKALEKLTSAGPAMKDVLAAVDKLGNGPGSKSAKAVNYKLSGLVGKAPIAAAGLGNFGLGGGGAHGIGTLGAELLHGKGGGGIGAMGVGNVGHGKVAGTVSHARGHDIAAQGNIDRDAVARTVNSHLNEVQACYERALLHEPGLAGKVVLEWTISTAGRVVAAKTKTSTLHSPSVESCILETLKTWQFPQAHGGQVIVSYPFLFNAVGY